jgi:hypothetical protein
MMFFHRGITKIINPAVPLLSRRWFKLTLMVIILGVAFFGVPALVKAADPSGGDTLAGDPTAPVNMAWTLIAGFLVFFMQLEFRLSGFGTSSEEE